MPETVTFSLVDMSRSFATRAKGQEVFAFLSKAREDTEAERVIVDWCGVNAASPSFIDEFVGRICETCPDEGLRDGIVITCDSGRIVELIDTVLRRRGYQLSYALKPEDVLTGRLNVLGDPSGSRPVLA